MNRKLQEASMMILPKVCIGAVSQRTNEILIFLYQLQQSNTFLTIKIYFTGKMVEMNENPLNFYLTLKSPMTSTRRKQEKNTKLFTTQGNSKDERREAKDEKEANNKGPAHTSFN